METMTSPPEKDLTYVVVSGNSGAGKSTLIKRLAAELAGTDGLSVHACDERGFHHPLLQNMFENPAQWALPIQLNFMTQRACRLMDLEQQHEGPTVILMERSLLEDRLFFQYYVDRGLIDAELLPAYNRLLASLISRTLQPTVIVHLRGQSETLFLRLEKAYENKDRNVELIGTPLYAYLEGMNALYDTWASKTRSHPATFLEFDIDAPAFDLDAMVPEVLAAIERHTLAQPIA